MKRSSWLLALLAAFAASPAFAVVTGPFNSEQAAAAACGTDEVVWIDLDNTKYYHDGQPRYGMTTNGAYTCRASAAGAFREADDPKVVSTTTTVRRTTEPNIDGSRTVNTTTTRTTKTTQ